MKDEEWGEIRLTWESVSSLAITNYIVIEKESDSWSQGFLTENLPRESSCDALCSSEGMELIDLITEF